MAMESMPFTRIWGDRKNWALVAFNTWHDGLEAGGKDGFGTGWNAGDRIVNALNPGERYTLGEGGKLSLHLDAYETKVFVREDNLQPLNPVVNSITPAHDATVPVGRRTITVGLSEMMNRETLSNSVLFDGHAVSDSELTISG